MLLVIGRLLAMRFGSARVVVLTTPTKMLHLDTPGIEWRPFFPEWIDWIPRGEELLRIFAVLVSRNLVLGGGSILSTTPSIRWKYFLLRLHRLFRPSGRRGLLGVSVGPFEDLEGERFAGLLLSYCDYASFRDWRSLKWAQAASREHFKNIPLVLLPDLTFALRQDLVPRENFPASKIVGIALRGDLFVSKEMKVCLRNLGLFLAAQIDSNTFDSVKVIAFQSGGQSLDPAVANELAIIINRPDAVKRV